MIPFEFLSFRFLTRASRWFLWRCLLMLVLAPFRWIYWHVRWGSGSVFCFNCVEPRRFPQLFSPPQSLVVHHHFPHKKSLFCSDITFWIYHLVMTVAVRHGKIHHHAMKFGVYHLFLCHGPSTNHGELLVINQWVYRIFNAKFTSRVTLLPALAARAEHSDWSPWAPKHTRRGPPQGTDRDSWRWRSFEARPLFLLDLCPTENDKPPSKLDGSNLSTWYPHLELYTHTHTYIYTYWLVVWNICFSICWE